jgi:hypothetical protein
MLRKNGATEAELEALSAWKRGSRIARIYTETADREQLSIGAAYKLLNGANDANANEA